MAGEASPVITDGVEEEGYDLPRLFGLATGMCYVAGLLITNIDLARYGIRDVELARPQYILTGVFWVLLNGLFAGWFFAVAAAPGLFFKGLRARLGHWYRAPFVILAAVFFTAMAEAMIFMAMIWLPLFIGLGAKNPSGLIIFEDLCDASMAGIGALFLFQSLGKRLNLSWLSSARKAVATATGGPEKLWPAVFGLAFLLFGLLLYSVSLYPEFTKTVGGGKPPSVKLVLDHPIRAVWPRGVWVSADGRRIGPVAMLMDSSSMLTVGPPGEPMTWFSTPGEPAPAIEFNKSMVATVINEWRPYMEDVVNLGGLGSNGRVSAAADFFRFSNTSKAVNGLWSYDSANVMPRARDGLTATSIPNEDRVFVLLAGGTDEKQSVVREADSYEEYTANREEVRRFRKLGISMYFARRDHTATLLENNAVLIAGGRNEVGLMDSAELFRFTEDGGEGFRLTGKMQTARFRHVGTALAKVGPLAGGVLISGGVGANGKELSSAEVYDPPAGIFTPAGPMLTARQGHTATLLKTGAVLITGGTSAGKTLATAELFDASTLTFRATGSLHDARTGHTATLLDDGRVLIAGGSASKGVIGSAEIYDPEHGVFVQTGGMITARAEHTATRLDDGSVLVAGGVDRSGNSTVRTELFDPWSESFRAAGNLLVPLRNARSVLLHRGEPAD